MTPPAEPALPAAARPLPAGLDAAGAAGWRERLAARLAPGWTASGLCFLWDLLLWPGLYGLLAFLRHDAAGAVGLDAATAARGAADAAGNAGFEWSVCAAGFLALALCLYVVGGYDRRTNFLSLVYMSEHLIAVAAAGVLGGLVIYTYSAFGQNIRPSRGVFLSSLAAFAPLSLVGRRTLRTVLAAGLARSYFLVLGTGERARHFYRSYLESPNEQTLRFVEPDPSQPYLSPWGDAPAPRAEADTREQLAALARGSSGIIVAEDARQLPADLLDWLTRLHYEQVPVYTLETFYERHWRRVPTYAIEPTWPLTVESHLASASAYSQAKRLFDIAAAGLALAVLSPVLLGLAAAIRLESGAPVLFRQQRVGRDRRPFTLFKLRTMFVRGPGAEGSLYTGKRDPRITPLGHWLRKLRLDELPQLWNVLRGDMSLIGPRAEWDRLVDGYEKEIPFYHFRHLVKPGITGWAQVNYPYGGNLEDTIQKLKYDLYYIRHYSLRLDAMIVLKTLHTMVWGKGQ